MTTPLEDKIALIDNTYPVAGQDNDSQGFRDNFNNIKDSLSLASSDIVELQSKAVLKSGIGVGGIVTNDLAGSKITNGEFREFYASAYSTVAPITVGQDIDLENGSFQSFVMNANIDFTFRGWPTTGKYGVVRVLLSAQNPAVPRTATFNSFQAQDIYYGNSGINDQLTPVDEFTVPATYVRPVVSNSPVASTTITLGDVNNLRVGMQVIYTPYGGTPNGGITTINAINPTTKVVTLANQVIAGVGTPPSIGSGDNIKFISNGARLIEAFTFDGGESVYISVVTDY
jgi:hypothetical protein